MLYSELVTLQSEYTYSANVELDIRNDIKLERFIPNSKTIELFRDYFLDIIQTQADSHSRILYGSYGTGKSHFLTVLSILLSKKYNSGHAFDTLIHRIKSYDANLANDIKNYEQNDDCLPFLVVPVTSDYPDFNTCVYHSLRNTLRAIGIDVTFKNFFDQALRTLSKWEENADSNQSLKEACKKNDTDVFTLKAQLGESSEEAGELFKSIFSTMTYGVDFIYEVESLTEAIGQANKATEGKYSGIVFIFDEFGRYLEDYIKDIKVKYIQNLAEFCDHGDYNNHIILVSHKEISLYTREYGERIIDEWKKIEGRFKHSSMNTNSEQCLSLIKDIIVKKNDQWHSFKTHYSSELKKLFDNSADFKGFMVNRTTGYDFFEGGYPVHPISLYALDKLSKKIAQNERTFFTFLASKEKNSLYDFLVSNETSEFHFVGLDYIYDYFEPNIKSNQTSDGYEVYKKLQIAFSKLIDSANRSNAEKLLKAIALIKIINDDIALIASKDVLYKTIDCQSEILEESLDELIRNRILIYKATYDRYEFYDASIFDINQLIEENIDNIADTSITNVLNSEFIDFILYPHSYNFEYKINRVFIPVFVRPHDFNKRTLSRYLPKYYDGALIMLLCKKNEMDIISDEEMCSISRSVIFANYEGESLVQYIKKYLAICYLDSVKDSFVAKDPSFEKELEFFMADAKDAIVKKINEWKAFHLNFFQVLPNDNSEKINSMTDLSNLASKIMFKAFPNTLIVNNELINKNVITGTINSSQKKAVHSIISGSIGKEHYGLSYLSPEYIIIRSVLTKNSILVQDLPHEKINLLPDGELSNKIVVATIEGFVENCKNHPCNFSQLYELLKGSPLGLRNGYLPTLLAAMLSYEKKGVIISSHGIEKEFSYNTLCEMIKRPDEYEISIIQWTSEQQAFISNLLNRFNSYIDIDDYTANNIKAIYDGMFLHFRVKSKFSRTTKRYVSQKTVQYRNIMLRTYSDYSSFILQILKEYGGDYWKELSDTPGNARDGGNNFKIFSNYINVYMVAPIIGLQFGRKSEYDPQDDSKDTAGMLAEIMVKNQAKLKYIYRLIILCDDSEGLTDDEKIDLAFRNNDAESVRKGMALYNSYFLGGLEVLHEIFVDECIDDDDYIIKMHEFVTEYDEKENMEDIELDIEELLK